MTDISKLAAQEVLVSQGATHVEGDIALKALILYLANEGVINPKSYRMFIDDVIADARVVIDQNPNMIGIGSDDAEAIERAKNIVSGRLTSFVKNL